MRDAATAGPRARQSAVLFPQSRGDGGRERLRATWTSPRRFAFVREVNTHIGVNYVATGLLFCVGAGILALLMRIQLAYG